MDDSSRDSSHFCIKATEIDRLGRDFQQIDHRVQGIEKHFMKGSGEGNEDGVVIQISDQVKTIRALIENGNQKKGMNLSRLSLWIIAALILIIAALLGIDVNLPG